MKALLLTALLISPLAQAADCRSARVPDVPVIPDGAEASLDEMYSAQTSVKEYVATGVNYLNCIGTGSPIYNHMVSKLNRVAGSYNDELRVYNQRKAAVASS